MTIPEASRFGGFLRSIAAPLSVLFVLLFLTSPLLAQPALVSKRLGPESASQSNYDFTLSSALDSILENSATTDLYDPITLENLRKLKEDAQPPWNADDIDPELSRRAVEKALAIQTSRNLLSTLNKGDLRPTLRSAKQALQGIQSFFRYSVQDNGKGLKVSKDDQGRKLLELSVQFNAKQGVDPQVRIGQDFRFRYDYTRGRPLLEYNIQF